MTIPATDIDRNNIELRDRSKRQTMLLFLRTIDKIIQVAKYWHPTRAKLNRHHNDQEPQFPHHFHKRIRLKVYCIFSITICGR